MLTTVPIEELQPGDLLPDGIGAPLDEGERNARILIRDAMAVPTQVHNLYQRARTVREVLKVGRMYVSVTMSTYAVVSLRKGSPVSVYRNDANSTQDAAPAVLEHTADCVSYLSDDVTGESYVCDCSAQNGTRVTRTVQASTVHSIVYPAQVKPFSYARSQFDDVEDDSEFYRIQVRSDARGAHTKWMNITPAQFSAIREILAEEES